MRRRTWISAPVAFLALLGVGGATRASAAEPTWVRAELSCRPETAPGRVLCELRWSAPPGLRLVWADALVVRAPEFARPLRSRVTPERLKEVGSSERTLRLAFVATSAGVGQVMVRARAVVCRGQGEQESCHPESQDLTAELRVGS
jgi:hypothetical protein